MISKEDKLIDKHSQNIESLKNNVPQVTFIEEYISLLEEYKKLSKRFGKTMKMNDTHELRVLKEGEVLKEKVTSTVKIAKEKLMGNISEQRILKESHQQQLTQANETIKQLQMQLAQANQRIVQPKKNSSDDAFKIESIPNINPSPYDTISLRELFIKEQHKYGSLCVGKLSIDYIHEFLQIAQKTGTSDGFYKAILRYIGATLGNEYIVYYGGENKFYIFTKLVEQKELVLQLVKFNNNKRFSGLLLNFSVGFVSVHGDDSYDKIMAQLEHSHTEAMQNIKGKNNIALAWNS